MPHLLSSGRHLLSRGGNLVTDSTDCQEDCCYSCVACALSGRIMTINISGIAAGADPPNCGQCSELNGAYGGDISSLNGGADGLSYCSVHVSGAAATCESGFTGNVEAYGFIYYNPTAAPISAEYGACPADGGGQSGPGDIPANSTVVVVWLTYEDTDESNFSKCFLTTVSGRLTCPFYDLALTAQTQVVGGHPCGPSATTVTVSVA